MVQVDLPAAFAIGQIFGLLSKDYLKKEPSKFTNKLLGPINLFFSCGFAPGGMFLLIAWPAWEVMYVTAWVEMPFDRPLVAAFYIIFGIIMVLLGNAGFILAHHWYRKGKDQYVVIGSIAGVVLTLLPFLLNWGVWLQVGSYAEVQTNSGYSFWESPFFSGWAWIMGYMAISLVAMGLWLRRVGCRVQP